MSYSVDPYEIELVEKCLNHNRAYQKLLYDRYKNSMYTLLVRMLSDQEEAADALQEAFIKVFISLGNYQKKSSLGAWIRTIVVREGLSKQKKTRYHEEIDESNQNMEPIVWDSNLTGEYLAKAISKLPEGYRNVFLLIEVEGYTHKEVSETIGISVGTSKSQLYYAKKSLQKKLAEIMD